MGILNKVLPTRRFKEGKILRRSDSSSLKLNGFPVSLLPGIRPTGCLAGSIYHDWAGIRKNTPVFIALGDLQCSTYACIQDSGGIAG